MIPFLLSVMYDLVSVRHLLTEPQSAPRAKNSPPDCFFNALSIPIIIPMLQIIKGARLSTLNYLEQMMGIEPTRSAWKAEVLPLNYICISGICFNVVIIAYPCGFVNQFLLLSKRNICWLSISISGMMIGLMPQLAVMVVISALV